jgi:hypothetical protein
MKDEFPQCVPYAIYRLLRNSRGSAASLTTKHIDRPFHSLVIIRGRGSPPVVSPPPAEHPVEHFAPLLPLPSR